MSRRCVILTGMMGAGKTDGGELLAEQLGYEFLDTDNLIKGKAGKPITKIFKEDGEAAFRSMENEVIQSLEGEQEKVIATGGGAVVNPDNRRVLYSLGHVVYLKASARELYLRVKNDTGRPLLQSDDPKGTIQKLLEEREDAYEKADIVIDTELLNVDEVVDKIIDEMAKRTVETNM